MFKILTVLSLVSATSAFLSPVVHRPVFFSLGPLYAEAVDEILIDAEDRMSKSVDSVRSNLGTIRTGRASTSMLDRVKCIYYGVETPLNQMANVNVPSAQQLTVEPYDKSTFKDIEKAIIEADLGLTPTNDGAMIRMNIPPLTEERRKQLVKDCKGIGEEGKVAIRNVRRDGVESIKKLEKKGEIGEDEMKDGLDEIQKMTDKRTKEVEDIVAAKEKDVMRV